jgi:hypothetical protein
MNHSDSLKTVIKKVGMADRTVLIRVSLPG